MSSQVIFRWMPGMSGRRYRDSVLFRTPRSKPAEKQTAFGIDDQSDRHKCRDFDRSCPYHRNILWYGLSPLLTCCQRFDSFGRERFSADAPVAAFDVLDRHPGDLAHAFAFDRDHRVGELL